jgi:DNA-binding CsgD family transcriptional regulator/tetratricopeptide (TPR) repeat protein
VELLLEREDELQTLLESVAGAIAGQGRTVLVGGEAGIGKTSLVRALEQRMRGEATFLRGACEALSVPVPLGPLRELVDDAGGRDPTELGSDDRIALARAVLEALVARAPAVAILEDAHWADPTTLDLLRILARRLEDTPVTLIVTYREDEVAANLPLGLLLGDLATYPAVSRMSLRPLSGNAIRELAGSSGLDSTELVRVTGGNPFLVVESIAAGGRLPASVRDAALARAGRLSPAAREVIDAAAVVGPRPEYGLLQDLHPGSGPAIEEGLARGVLVAEDDELRFRHELIREAIEASISPPRRESLHARIVAALAGRGGQLDYARLAHHAELGGLADQACAYAGRAAREAAGVGALREAQLQAERALRLGTQLEPLERFELLLLRSRAANFASTELGEAAVSARDAIALAEELGDDVRRGRALIMLAWALWSMDSVAEASAAARQAIDVLEQHDDLATLARAHSTYIRIEASAIDPEVAIADGARALELARLAGEDEVALDLAISIGLAHGHRADGEGAAILEDALSAARKSGLAIQTIRSCVNLMVLATMQRDHDRAERVASEALRVCEQYHSPIPARAIESFHARSLADRGRWDEAIEAIGRSTSTWHAEVPTANALQGLIELRRGSEAGWNLIRESWRAIETLPVASRHGMMRAALVEGAWLCGEHETAREHLRAAAATAATARFARAASDLAVWAARYDVPFDLPPGAPDAARLEVAGDWRAAIRAWRELDAPYEAALAALPGDDHAARDALGTFHRLGAGGAARAFTRERAALGRGLARGPRRSTLANPAGLTRREQEILAQLATGASNPAIAARLHLSERTVAHHVSAILGKLGTPNRVLAIDRARALGLLSKDGSVDGKT